MKRPMSGAGRTPDAVRRLGAGDRLAKTLTNANAIPSDDLDRALRAQRDAVARRHHDRAVGAGMVNVQRSLRRVAGGKDMPVLVTTLRRHIEAVTPAGENKEAA